MTIETTDEAIQIGDLYIAERNTGPKLLTARKIVDGYIVPYETGQYCYEIWECRKVKS